MKILFTAILGLIVMAGLGYAQEDNVLSATATLQDVLTNLKQSIERLSLDNAQLAARDKDVQTQVLHLQMQLERLQAGGEAMNKEEVQLQDKNPRRTQQITRLEDENSKLDDRIQGTENAIQAIQRSMDAGAQEDQRLFSQLKDMANAPPLPSKARSPESQAVLQHQKERLKLMKMIYDSQQRQEALHRSIMEYQKSKVLPPADALAHQQLLKEQIKDLEEQLAAYPPQKPSANLEDEDQWDNDQMGQLELELKALEKNYLQLKDLMEKMSKKAQTVQMTAAQKIETQKLQNSMDDLNRQNTQLKADLGSQRAQLIELDKRKSYLELMTRKSS